MLVMQEFRKSLTRTKSPTPKLICCRTTNGFRSNLKSEIFVDAFGQEEGLKVKAETDPEVLKGFDLLPQARALAENARKVIAETE